MNHFIVKVAVYTFIIIVLLAPSFITGVHKMKEHLDLLGYSAKDRITGFEGVVDSVCFDLYGCVQASLIPEHDKKDKEPKSGRWFDVSRLKVTDKKRVMEPVTPQPPTGPADKAPPR